jgi:hypothetical protein
MSTPRRRPPLWIGQPLVRLGSRELLDEIRPPRAGTTGEVTGRRLAAGAHPLRQAACQRRDRARGLLASASSCHAVARTSRRSSSARLENRSAHPYTRQSFHTGLTPGGDAESEQLHGIQADRSAPSDGWPAVHRRCCSVFLRMTLVTRVRASRPARRVGGLPLESRRTTP